MIARQFLSAILHQNYIDGDVMPYTAAEKADLESASANIETMKRSDLVALFQRNGVPFKKGASAKHLRAIYNCTVVHFVIERMASQPRAN